jgi:hypothetical protein
MYCAGDETGVDGLIVNDVQHRRQHHGQGGFARIENVAAAGWQTQ